MIVLKASLLGLATALALTGLSNLAAAQDRPLRPIDSFSYEPSAVQRGVFTVPANDRRIRALRIQAKAGSATIRAFTVVYSDGRKEVVAVRQNLVPGERTSLFRLAQQRPVKAIEVEYVPRGAVTLVLLADGRPGGPEVSWVDLGCKSVGFLVDKDKLAVTSEDRFRSLRLRSNGFNIELLEMLVRYGNGTRDNFVIRQVIPSGSVTSPIDLRGERRRISQIDFLYRTQGISTQKTRLCVEGLRDGE